MQKIKVNTGRNYFGIVNIGGKTYVCPGWIEVPLGTTREQIELDLELSIIKPEVDESKPEITQDRLEFEATSSKGDKIYKVTFEKGRWDCTCPARMYFKGHCKHIKKFEAETLSAV